MASGHTLWEELVMHYTHGVDYVRQMSSTWATLAPFVDSERFAETSAYLRIQEKESQWWRDATLAYFDSISKRTFPQGFAVPPRTLQEYEAISIPLAPGHTG
jgi:alpha-glucuronidase